MPYDATVGNNFWFEFDDTFKDHPTQTTAEALLALFPGFAFDIYLRKWLTAYDAGTLPQAYLAQVQKKSSQFAKLAELQDTVFEKYFHASLADEQAAFEDFGQGVLYDPRRDEGNRVHMMDVNENDQQIGYHRWFAFGYALQVLNLNQAVWAPRLKLIVLAFAIHTEAKPKQDSPTSPHPNPALPPTTLAALRTKWMAATDAERAKFLADTRTL